MSTAYYYLVSSLPMLRLGETPPLDSDEFLHGCAGHLSESGLSELTCVSLLPRENACCSVERSWRDWETCLRNTLVAERAGRTQGEAERWLRPERDVFPGDQVRIEEALAGDDPLARERALDELRWEFLDGLCAGREFQFDVLVAYRVQLLLCEKWAAISEESGQSGLSTLESGARAQALDRRQTAAQATL